MHPLTHRAAARLGAQARLAAALMGAGGASLSDETVAGMPTLVGRPGRGSAWPAVIFVNGVTRRGRHHPEVRRAARRLASAGFLVLVPELPGLRTGVLGDATVRALVDAVRVAIHMPGCQSGRAGLLGVSTGTSMALIAAEDAAVAERISVVAGLAPFADLRGIVRLATTGTYPRAGVLEPYPAGPFLSLVIARSLAVGLTGPDGQRIQGLLGAVADGDPDPLRTLRATDPAKLGGEARALRAVLVNREPASFDELYAALPGPIRAGVERLSPLTGIDRLRAPAELATAPVDKYFPLAESQMLAAHSPLVRLTVSPALGHYRPEISLAGARELARVNAFGVRTMQAAICPGSVCRL